ncbi:MAG TPA: hypothetical protein VGA45_07545 [Actinomycetota bacterium]
MTVVIEPQTDRSTGHGRTGPWLFRALRRRGRAPWPDHWPFTALTMGFPLWWAIGFGPAAVTVFAAIMAWKMRRMGPIKVPRGFGLWLCFLLTVLISGLMLGKTAPNTLPDRISGQVLGYGLRFAAYIAAAVVMLYVGNLGEKKLPEKLLLRCLLVLFGVTIAGGLLGMAAPYFQFTAPIAHLLPHAIASNSYVHLLTHPGAAQVQDVLGYSAPRPKAPYEYTNMWGNVTGLLVVWFVAWASRDTLRRVVAVPLLAVAAVPIVFSLNRGLWVGLALAVAVYGVRLLLSGRMFAVLGVATAALVGVVVLAASPLGTVLQERLQNPQSNDIRENLATAAFHGAQASPIVGWGTQRDVLGSFQSIAIGASPGCEGRCGNAGIGSTGAFWLVMFAYGFVGLALYIGFFLAALWFYRGDRTATGIAAQITIVMSLWFMFAYSSPGWPLTLAMIAVAVLWRHRMQEEGVP